MKLSQAIEEVLLSGAYNQCNEFMCNVLNDEYDLEMEQELQSYLSEIFQNEGKRPLINQLWDIERKKPGFVEEEFWNNYFKRTQEWYVWFVFDLKRKGL